MRKIVFLLVIVILVVVGYQIVTRDSVGADEHLFHTETIIEETPFVFSKVSYNGVDFLFAYNQLTGSMTMARIE